MVAVSILSATVTPAFANDGYIDEAPAYEETVEYTDGSDAYTEEAVDYTAEAAECTEEASPVYYEEPAEYTEESVFPEETAEYTEVSTPVDETAEEETPAVEAVSADEETTAEETDPAEDATEDAAPEEAVNAEDQAADSESAQAESLEDTAGSETEPDKEDADADELKEDADANELKENTDADEQKEDADTAGAAELPTTEEEIRDIIKNTDPSKKDDKYEDIHTPGSEEEEEKKPGSFWKEAESVARDVVTQGLWVLSSVVPSQVGSAQLGRMAVPYWQKLFDYISGKNTDPGITLSDISKQLGEFQGDLERHTNKILEKTETSDTLRNYGNRLDVVNASVKQIIATISGNEKIEGLSAQDKLVFTARALGNVGVGESNSFLVNLDLEAQALYGGSKSDIKGRDLFQAIYDYNKYKYMLSSEVIEGSQQFINECMDHYIFSYAVAMQCLDAYRQVLNFDENDKAKLSEGAKEAYKDLIKASSGTILETMQNLSRDITGLKASDGSFAHTGIAQHLVDFRNGDKFVFVNKGKAEVHLSDTILVSDYENHSYDSLSKVLESNPMSAKDTEDLVNYIKNEWKGGSILTYLKKRGFKFATVSKGDYANREQACKIGYDFDAVAGVIDKNKTSFENYASRFIGAAAAAESMKKNTYLAAGKQSMTTTSKRRTKSWTTIKTELYHGFYAKKGSPVNKDCVYHTTSGTKKQRTGCALTFQSK